MIQKLIVVFLLFVFSGFTSDNFVRSEFYKAFQGDSAEKIEGYIAKIEDDQSLNGYSGALYLKLSGLQKGGSKKLNSFKKGKLLLDSTIKTDPTNPEWRFLRLVIQENVPPFLKYSNQIEEDRDVIIKEYSSCDAQLKKIIKGYTQKSKVLKASDLP